MIETIFSFLTRWFSPSKALSTGRLKAKFKKLRPDAVAPQKAHSSDSGYDVYIVELERIPNTNLWKGNTGIAVEPPKGFYFDLVARSSLAQKGWHLVGGVGIIDQTYTGPIIMLLEKIDHHGLPKLPFKAGQLIPRQFIHFELEEVEELSETERGSGGFGSTDKR